MKAAGGAGPELGNAKAPERTGVGGSGRPSSNAAMNRRVDEHTREVNRRFPVVLALLYLGVAATWILFSDQMLAALVEGEAELTRWQSYKGWLFVAVTSLLLYLFARRHTASVQRFENSLRSERDFIGGVLETVDAPVLVMDTSGRIVRFNRACELLSGYRAEEVVGLRPDPMLPADEKEGFNADLEALRRDGGTQTREYQWLTPDGQRRRIVWSFRALVDAAGAPAHIIAAGIDVTAQREAMTALEASQRKYHRLLETANDAILVADAETGCIVEANDRASELFGVPAPELVGLHQSRLYPPEERERYQRLFSEHVNTGRAVTETLEVVHRDGRHVPVEISASTTELEGRRLVQGIFRDVTERLQAEAQLRKLSRVVEASPNPIVITDADGTIEYCNPRFYENTGYSPEEALGQTPRILKSGETPPDEYRQMWKTIKRGEIWFGEFCNRKKDGQQVWWLSTISPIKDETGTITHFVAIAEDIGELKYAEDTIRHLAYFDPLTELPNRTLFKDRLGQAAVNALHYGESLGLMFIDLDRFKTINDTLGHQQGDHLLRQVAERLRAHLPDGASLARLGGDEFAVILPAVREPEGLAVGAARILDALNEPFDLDGQEVIVTVSIGLTSFPQDADDTGTLISNADLAMFRAKEVGRNTYEFYTEEMNTTSFEHVSLHASLKRALEREEFELYYQPKVHLGRTAVSGMEALVRWRHPEMGLLSPAKFIPVAEETGLIVPLGEWVLWTACGQAKAWMDQGHGHLAVSVNLSAQQFNRRELSDRVAEVLEGTGLPAECLELEITETDVMQNAVQTIEILHQLKAMGVRIAIDDFGTGYSSLNYLKRFPIDVLKVDQSFVRDVTTDPDDAAIARSVIALAHNMRLSVVAEGVETAEHLRFFQDEQCEEVQGFYFSRPVPAPEFTGLLTDPAWLRERLEPDR